MRTGSRNKGWVMAMSVAALTTGVHASQECGAVFAPEFYWHPLLPQLEISYPSCAGAWYELAALRCKRENARVCTYEDYYAIYAGTGWSEFFNVKGKWIGNMVGDDDVLCGNKDVTYTGDPDYKNFEGACNKHDTRQYFCCRDVVYQ